MTQTWTLAEFPGDVGILAKAFQPGDHWVAVTATAVEELEQFGVPYLLEGDLCPITELDRIGKANFHRAEALVQALDSVVFGQCPTVRKVGLAPFEGHYSLIKILLDAVSIRAFILRRLIDEGGSLFRKTRAFPRNHGTDPVEFYNSEVSLYEDLVDDMAAQGLLSAESFERPAFLNGKQWPQRRAVFNRLSEIRRGFFAQISSQTKRSNQGRRILFLGSGYSLGLVGRRYLEDGDQVFWLDVSVPRLYRFPGRWEFPVRWSTTDMTQVQSEVLKISLMDAQSQAKELCQEDGFPSAALIGSALETYLQREFPRAVAVRSLLEASHRQLGFDLLLSPFGPQQMRARAVFDFCQSEGIPVKTCQHGGYAYTDNPIVNHYGFAHKGDFLSWGTGVGEHYGRTKRGGIRIQPVGSPVLDNLLARRQQTAKRPKRVMFIISDFRGYSAYFPGGTPSLDTNRYRFQCQVLNVLQKFQDEYDIWLKVPPGMDSSRTAQNPVRDWLRTHHSKIKVEARPLLEVIDQPGIFIIDVPGTSLLECLATKAQVTVFTGAPFFGIIPRELPDLKQRATCCNTEDEFLATIEAQLSGGLHSAGDRIDDTFLARFGTHLNDGRSLDRMYAALG